MLIFDGSLPAGATFTRDVATRDFYAARNVNEPRFGEPVATATTHPWTDVITTATDRFQSLGKPVDQDASGAFFVAINVTTGHATAIQGAAVKTEDWSLGSFYEWRKSADREGTVRHIPKGGLLLPINGVWTWVVVLERQTFNDPDWETVGVSIGVAHGVTFDDIWTPSRTIHADLTSTLGVGGRGREWAISYNPVSGMIGFTDYFNDEATETKAGGQAFVMSVSPDSANDRYTLGTPVKVVEEAAGDTDYYSTGLTNGEHAHSCWPYHTSSGDLRAAVAWGDTSVFARVEIYEADDPVTPTSWTLINTLRHDQPLLPLPVSSDGRQVLMSCDGGEDGCHVYTLPDASEAIAVGAGMAHRWGAASSPDVYCPYILSLTLGDYTTRQHYAVVVQPLRGVQSDDVVNELANTIMYRLGASGPWIDLGYAGDCLDVIICGGYVYTLPDTDEGGIRRCKLPTNYRVTGKPLLLQPGGKNRSVATQSTQAVASGCTVTQITTTDADGRLVDDGFTLPFCPGQTTVWRITAPLAALPAPSTGSFYPLTLRHASLGVANPFPRGRTSGHAWICPRPGTSFYGQLRVAESAASGHAQYVQATASDRWTPVLWDCTEIDEGTVSDPYRQTIRITSQSNDGSTNYPATCDVYLCVSNAKSVTDAAGSMEPSYDIAPSDSTFVSGSKEALTISVGEAGYAGLDLWIPRHCADSLYAEMPRTGGTPQSGEVYYPCLIEDASNYIGLRLDRDNRQWELVEVVSGTPTVLDTATNAWVNADGNLNVRMSWDSGGIRLAICQRGNDVLTLESQAALNVTPASLTFGDPAGSLMGGVAVVAIDTSTTTRTTGELGDLARVSLIPTTTPTLPNSVKGVRRGIKTSIRY